jgi:hypothetical protein
MAEKGLDLGSAQLARMAAPVKTYEPADPADVGSLRARAIVL